MHLLASINVFVNSNIQIEENLYIAKAKITLGDRVAEGEIEDAFLNPEKREISDLVKKSVYFACKKSNNFSQKLKKDLN